MCTKTALLIILGENFINYDVACTLLILEPLSIRRDALCLKFARKDLKKDDSLFIKNTVNIRDKKLVIEPKSNTRRFAKSSIPYLSRLLNSNR